MGAEQRDSVEFERCTSCGGVWIERYGLSLIMGRAGQEHELDWTRRPAEIDKGRPTGIRCNVCEEELIARRTRGVELDVCRGCGGLFLDPTELETLRADARREARIDRLENVMGAGEELAGELAVNTAWDVLLGAIRGLLRI